MTNDLAAIWANEGQMPRPMLQSPSEGRLVSCSLPAPGISAAKFLQLAEGQERFFWQSGRNQPLFAGFGVAGQLMAWGAGRFQDIERKTRALFQEALQLADQPDLAAPRLFGGFSFSDDFTPDNAWAVFHPAHFFLPHYQFAQSGEHSWLTINAFALDEEDIDGVHAQLQSALVARREKLQEAEGSIPDPLLYQSAVRPSYPMSYQNWECAINKAVAVIDNTDLDKVVLSRVCELRSKERIDVLRALSYLNQNYEECTRFLFEPRPYHAFYGATPELLIQTSGHHFKTMALAGSMPRGDNPGQDVAKIRKLLNSDKDRHEHALVVDSIKRRMGVYASELDFPEDPQIYTLNYIHHLLTPIQGYLKQRAGVLPLVEALHPTPALGGSPRDLALEFIRQAEPVPRGWYAGPVGWIDAHMDGEFAVGIRSAVAQDRRVWLYAGAGIVAESDPQKEWLETSLKFQPMFRALGLSGIEKNINSEAILEQPES